MKKIAIVTGATGGLGGEFVKAIFKEGLDEIWAVGRNETKLQKLKTDFGEKLRIVRCDLSSVDGLDQLDSMIKTENPDIRILVNNAGMGDMGKSEDFSTEEITKTIDINCKAICLLCNYSIPYMRKGARILNISSASSFQPTPYINLYAATKVFVRSYSRALNVELASKGIVCTAVCPGWIDTEMLSKEYNGKKVHFPGLTSAKRVAVQAMKDSAKGRDMSICTGYANFLHLYGKFMPQKIVMKQWLRGIKDYI